MEVFIESFSIVLLEIGIEDESSLFDKKSSLLTIDELSYMLPSFRGLHEGNPGRIGSAVLIGDDLDALTISQDIVEGDDLTIDLGDREFISELRMDHIGEVDGSRSFWEGDDISFRCEDKYLIGKDIHTHLTHELFPFDGIFHNSLDRLHPVAIFRFCRFSIF